jgi:hypothetical protein
MDDRELRQYFEDLYVTFLGSYLKSGHTQNPDDILHHTELHWKAMVQRMKELNLNG